MQRILISDIHEHIGETVRIKGWVRTKRDHGKVTFIDCRDRSGVIQLVGYKKMMDLGHEDVIDITGTVKKRAGQNVNPNMQTGGIEVDVEEYTILAKAGQLPFDISKDTLDLELPTLLDHRALTLRHPKVQAIFKVQAVIIDAFREYLQSQGFMEFQAPAITPAVAEGGSEVFEINYFDKKAYLTQSPQLYKQIVMSAFERVFSVNKIFRAEPSVTTRHITEIVSLDAEMAFIEDWTDVRDMADAVIRYIFGRLEKECAKELALFQATLPAVIEKTPTISLSEGQDMIFENLARDVRGEKDLNPEDERDICSIMKEKTGSDLVFVYGFPTRKKPFYVYPDPENPEFNQGVDLLCRGVELLSGGRRINDYAQLDKHVKEWKMDPEKIRMFLDAFRYGVPPEGGFAFGAERITMQILGLANIREATMFPRDMERIDYRLSSVKTETKLQNTSSVFESIVDMLKSHDVPYELFEHEATLTSEDSARLRGTTLHQGAKALVLQSGERKFMYVLPADEKADLKALAAFLKQPKVTMVPIEDVEKMTGLPKGSIPPYGSIVHLQTYCSQTLLDNEEIAFNAGRLDRSIKMKTKDFLHLEKPTMVS